MTRPAISITVLATLLGGCATLAPPPPTPSPPLHLLDAAGLVLPTGCTPTRGAVYRTRFVVEPGGRVTGALSDSGDGCVQQALREWVSSFRYEPPDAAVPVVVDWMDVAASRGG